MNKTLRGFLFWTPRVLGILIAGLLNFAFHRCVRRGLSLLAVYPGFS